MENFGIFKRQFDALPSDGRDVVRDEIACCARDFQAGRGLAIPHEYLLAIGTK